jgi:hypothetical protein
MPRLQAAACETRSPDPIAIEGGKHGQSGDDHDAITTDPDTEAGRGNQPGNSHVLLDGHIPAGCSAVLGA